MTSKIISVAFVFLSFLNVFYICAQTGGGSLPIDIKNGKDNPRHRPRVPALYSGVMAEYDGSVLSITFDEPEGVAYITVTDYYGEEIYSGSADTCAPISIMLGAISNPVEISVSTSAGNTYIGYLYAQ